MGATGEVCGTADPVGAAALAADFYRGVVDGMRCGILVVDRGGRIVVLNDHARAILELDANARAGDPVEAVLHGQPQLARILREAFVMTSLPNRAEIPIQSATQPEKTIGFTLSFVRGDRGEPSGAAVFFKDLTHVEHKEEQERLRDRLAALGQMAANLAHEIRNPLASIEVSCSLLKRRIADDQGKRDLLDKIIGEVRRLNGTITSSLEFVRPVSFAPAPARIDAVLDAALAVASGRRGRPGIRVERRYDASVPEIVIDRGQMQQVFENLFLNAFEAMGEQGVLTVETRSIAAPAAPTTPYRPLGDRDAGDRWCAFDRYVVVRVTDTGAGIAEEHLDKLFYPFFTTKKHGSGVGLSMAKKIVDTHRGLMDVESGVGRGTTFTVRLPMIVSRREDEGR